MAERFDDVTVLFADIAGFTEMSERLEPLHLVNVLNQIFSTFDELVERHGLVKIKTIGDAYMVASGLPRPRSDHASAVARFAVEVRDVVARARRKSKLTIDVRIGIHSGPVLAGVLGRKRFAYDLWGDTVNTASRMESHGETGRIQISDATRTRIGDAFTVVERGVIDVKGKGTRPHLVAGEGSVIGERATMHPWTLSFEDPELETAFWADFTRQFRSYMRVGYVAIVLLMAAFWVVDVLVYPDRARTLALVRFGVGVPLLLLAWPVLFVERWRGVLERHVQGWLLYLATTSFGTLIWISWIVLQDQDRAGTFVAALGAFVAFEIFYGFSRIRFVYAAPLGTVLLLALIPVLLGPSEVGASLFAFWIVFAILVLAVGWIVSYSLEYYTRLDYVRRRELETARSRAEGLLLNVLPAEIAELLKFEPRPMADRFDEVTVLFADIVGFTPLAEKLEPTELIEILDGIFSDFDQLTETHGVEKIKTIGDAYMVAGGIPRHRPDHAVALAHLALDMRRTFHERCRRRGLDLDMRIGIHSGPALAGIIGKKTFAYDLWGDTVNTASRMESHGAPGEIQITAETRALLDERFEIEERGTIEVKGKGSMQTWWLRGLRDPTEEASTPRA